MPRAAGCTRAVGGDIIDDAITVVQETTPGCLSTSRHTKAVEVDFWGFPVPYLVHYWANAGGGAPSPHRDRQPRRNGRDAAGAAPHHDGPGQLVADRRTRGGRSKRSLKWEGRSTLVGGGGAGRPQWGSFGWGTKVNGGGGGAGWAESWLGGAMPMHLLKVNRCETVCVNRCEMVCVQTNNKQGCAH